MRAKVHRLAYRFKKLIKSKLPIQTLSNIIPIKSVSPTDERMVQMFDTFGFVKLEGYLKPEIEALSKEFDRMMVERFGKIVPNRHYFYPQFADNSPLMTEIIDSPKISNLARALCGDGYMYKGSDGNIFVGGSAWHRDYLLRVKSIKMLIYLEHNDATSGALSLLPGSQFIDDAYSAYLTQALTWPEPPIYGGFDEKGLFPKGNNPTIRGENQIVPYVTVETKPGDVIIFNHNILHCVNLPHKPKVRRLFGFHFCTDLTKVQPGPESDKEMEQVKQLALTEMRQFDLPNFYGKCILERNTPSMLQQTQVLRQLSTTNRQNFDGTYAVQSQESIDFGNINKTNNHLGRRFRN